MKVCQIIFSTNRPEYLTRTLAAQERYLDTSGCDVEKIVFDDFPKGRDDEALRALCTSAGYGEVYFHRQNLSIGATWQECWNLIRHRDYDFVWHQEDDVVLLEQVRLLDLIAIQQLLPRISQVVLKRGPCFPGESEVEALESDVVCDPFRGEFNAGQVYFTPIASLYPAQRADIDYQEWYRAHYPDDSIFHTANVNEALIGKALLEGWGLTALHVKSKMGAALIAHIGEYTRGKKVLPHEPGYAAFAGLDPDVDYWSNTHQPYRTQI